MKFTGDYAVLRTGKKLYTNGGIIGLSFEGLVEGHIHQGYDGTFGRTDPTILASLFSTTLTPEEVDEITDYMRELWFEFKQRWGSSASNKSQDQNEHER